MTEREPAKNASRRHIEDGRSRAAAEALGTDQEGGGHVTRVIRTDQHRGPDQEVKVDGAMRTDRPRGVSPNAPSVIRAATSYGDGTTIEDFEQVLDAASAGAEWAAALLFDALQPALLRYLRWEEPGAADDLAGETWLAVAERIQGFTGDERALRAWVFSVARRRLADHRRRGARRRTQSVAPQDLNEVPGGEDPADVVLEALSAQQAIDHLVAVLSPGQAEVLVLRVVARLSVEDVAQILGKRPGTVRVMEHRALRRLSGEGVDHVPTTRRV